MKWAWLSIIAFSLLMLGMAVAQAPPPADVQQVLNQIHQVGCNAEEQASAQTIAQLQKENSELKAKLQKLDPPRSGATKK